MEENARIENPREQLRLENVAKSFSQNHVLIDVNLSIDKGEVRALVGENGAGKSTMIRIIAGASRADSGRIILDGKECRFTSPRDSLEAGIAVIYQELDLLPELTVTENIFLGIELKNRYGVLDKRAMAERVEAYFKEMNLDIDKDVKIGSLPIAAQQVVAISKAAMHQAKLIIMDEPSSSLTDKELEVLFKQIRRLKESGVTVIYISHRLEEIYEICDSVTVLRDGRIIQTVPVKETSREQIVEWMIGRKVNENRMNQRAACETPSILEVRDLSYGNAVHSVSFDVKKGEIFGVLGLLGSGFIEIGKLLYGIYPPSSGTIRMNGKDISSMHSPVDALSNSISYVPDQRRAHGLFLEMSVLNNATITSVHKFLTNKALGILNRKAMDASFRKYIKKFEIKIVDENQFVRYLSGGNQQKVIIARALLSDTEVIIMSCPTRGIDVGSKYDIYRILMDCAEQGKTVIVISQEIPELVQICDRILMLKKGRVFREYSGEEISETQIYNDLLSQ